MRTACRSILALHTLHEARFDFAYSMQYVVSACARHGQGGQTNKR